LGFEAFLLRWLYFAGGDDPVSRLGELVLFCVGRLLFAGSGSL